MTVLDSFFAGNIRALSRVVSYVENREEGYQKVLARLYERARQSVRVGLTGPPGAGKSTIVNGLAQMYLGAGKKVGVIAVDPTSPFTGGALLGDRVRLGDFPVDGSFYFRSMATRGATGGLAGATDNVTVVYDAFGFDITLIETVGVGQVELDIIDTCDTVVVAIVPESGDAVQTMKAGLTEIADIFCVNKADRPGAEQVAADLRIAIKTLAKQEHYWTTPVITTEALNRKNIDLLYEKINEHLAIIRSNSVFETHRRNQLKKKVLNIVKNRFQQEFLERLSAEVHFDTVIDKILTGETNPFELSDQLYHQFSGR